MEPIYVTGHKNPDTDSIVAAIAYAGLRNALGDRNFVAARIGDLSDETNMVLAKFGFEAPQLLRTVRTQVADLDYDTPPILSSAVTVHHAWESLQTAKKAPALPVTDEDGKLFGMLTSDDIASYDMRFVSDNHLTGIPLFNLLSCLDGQLWSMQTEPFDLSGELVLALPDANGVPDFPENSIVVCGNQPKAARRAIENKVSCLIVCQSEMDRSLYENCGQTCVISTPYDAYIASRMICMAIPISRICHSQKDVVTFHLTDYLDDVKEATLKSRYRSYPILDENDLVVGTLSRYHLLRPKRKRVVLVDHNELAQSVPGLEQAEILEIIDHHRLADVQTGAPVYVRNEPVGSTCTILTSMYFEKGIMPSKKLAGLLAAAIVSDTIMFKSPTCTQEDHVMAERMARIAGISLEDLGREIFSVSISGDHDLHELLFSDFKQFQIAGHSLGIGQVTCLDSERIAENRKELMAIMEQERAERDYDMLLLMVTDVLREGTELIAVGDVDTVAHAFNVRIRDGAVFLPGVLSRKKQVVPALSLLWG